MWLQARPTASPAWTTVGRFSGDGRSLPDLDHLGCAAGWDRQGALQRWDGKYWRSVLTVPITKGKATMSVRAAGRGTTTTYRIAVPGMSYYGLPIQTIGSRAFKLTVR